MTDVGEAPLPFELDSLARAPRYQAFLARAVMPLLGQRVLEVGAGVGNLSAWLPRRQRLILSEADPVLLARLRADPRFAGDPDRVRLLALDLATGAGLEEVAAEAPDTVVSFNVLEHIEDDAAALGRLCALLRASPAPGPHRLVTVVPAHRFAHGELDRAFGHHRRYDLARVRALAAAVADDATLSARHLNLFGLPGWIVAGRVLRRRAIGQRTIAWFERLLPVLGPLDEWVQRRLRPGLGQSLLFTLSWPARVPERRSI